MRAILRWSGRMGVALLVSSCILLIVVQYYQVVRHVFTLAHDLQRTKHEIADLRSLRDRQTSDIRRLSDPRGAIPEIHDRLRLVGPHEMLIYVEGAPTPTPLP